MFIELWQSFSPEYRFYLVVVALFIPLTIAGVIAQIKVNSAFSNHNVPADCWRYHANQS